MTRHFIFNSQNNIPYRVMIIKTVPSYNPEGLSVHKVAEEKLHKRMSSQNKRRRCPASQTLAYAILGHGEPFRGASMSFLPCPSSHCSLHNCSLRPPLGQEKYCNLAQNACCTSQMKYTLQGCAYDCVHTLTYA